MAGLGRYIPDGRPSGSIQSKYDVPPPVTTYAYSAAKTPLHASLNIPPSTNRSGSAVVNRRPLRNGLQFFYSHGAVSMDVPLAAVAEGGVNSSRFQTVNVQLMDWQNNTSWHQAGYPRNLGWVTRVAQVDTKSSGGPTNATMEAKPAFNRVQRVPRYQAIPKAYPTRSAI